MINLYKIVKDKKLLFIDIDDTILNYTKAHNKALNKVLYKWGFSLEEYNIARNEVKKRIKGVNNHKKELYFKVMGENRGIFYETILYIIKEYKNFLLDNIKIDFSIKELIDDCRLEGIKVCAVSNFYTEDQLKKLSKCNILNKFNMIITSEDFDVEKPSRKLFDYALNKFNLKESDSIMIGDSFKYDNIKEIDFFHYNTNNIFFGVCGKSGCGKSTISDIIKNIFNSKILHGDSYHKWERNHNEWKNITHYSPEANNIDQLENDIFSLYSKENISIRNYNHSNGKFDSEQLFTYNDSIILDGLHSLYTYDIYKYMKYKIFVLNHNCDNLKIKRDVEERNKKVEDVVESIEKREPDYNLYIHPQKNNANIIIEIFKSRLKILFKKEEFIRLENIFEYENVFYFEDDLFFQLNFNYSSLDEYKEHIKNVFNIIKRYS